MLGVVTRVPPHVRTRSAAQTCSQPSELKSDNAVLLYRRDGPQLRANEIDSSVFVSAVDSRAMADILTKGYYSGILMRVWFFSRPFPTVSLVCSTSRAVRLRHAFCSCSITQRLFQPTRVVGYFVDMCW